MFSNILVPVDGSSPAKRAAKYGLELAVTYGASVDLLYVVERGVLSDEGLEAKRREQGRAVLEDVRTLDVEGSPSIETHLVVGTPSEVIATHVDDHDVDLVAMGRHGRSGVGEHLFGTVAERVLRTVEVPVLTVAGETVREDTGRTYGDVLLTTDGSDVAERAAPYGADVARHTGATVHLLTVVDVTAEAGPFDAGGISEEYLERLEDRGRDALDRLARRVDETGTDVDLRSTLVRGTPAAEIDSYAEENGIDLVVMASRGETNLLGQQIGSTTRRLLRTVRTPVLVVPAPE